MRNQFNSLRRKLIFCGCVIVRMFPVRMCLCVFVSFVLWIIGSIRIFVHKLRNQLDDDDDHLTTHPPPASITAVIIAGEIYNPSEIFSTAFSFSLCIFPSKGGKDNIIMCHISKVRFFISSKDFFPKELFGIKHDDDDDDDCPTLVLGGGVKLSHFVLTQTSRARRTNEQQQQQHHFDDDDDHTVFTFFEFVLVVSGFWFVCTVLRRCCRRHTHTHTPYKAQRKIRSFSAACKQYRYTCLLACGCSS